MTNLQIGLAHHSLAQSRTVTCRATLSAAKRLAIKEFGDEQHGYTIVIYDRDNGEKLAQKTIGAARWVNI